MILEISYFAAKTVIKIGLHVISVFYTKNIKNKNKMACTIKKVTFDDNVRVIGISEPQIGK